MQANDLMTIFAAQNAETLLDMDAITNIEQLSSAAKEMADGTTKYAVQLLVTLSRENVTAVAAGKQLRETEEEAQKAAFATAYEKASKKLDNAIKMKAVNSQRKALLGEAERAVTHSVEKILKALRGATKGQTEEGAKFAEYAQKYGFRGQIVRGAHVLAGNDFVYVFGKAAKEKENGKVYAKGITTTNGGAQKEAYYEVTRVQLVYGKEVAQVLRAIQTKCSKGICETMEEIDAKFATLSNIEGLV